MGVRGRRARAGDAVAVAVFALAGLLPLAVDAWTGTTQHRANAAAVDDLLHSTASSEASERNEVYAMTNRLRTEFETLQLVASPRDLAEKADGEGSVSYERALELLASTFVEMDKVTQLVVAPLEHQRAELQEECMGTTAALHAKMKAASAVLARLSALQSEIDEYNKLVDLSESERMAFQSRLLVHMQQLMIQLSSDTPSSSSSNASPEPVSSREFVAMQLSLIRNLTTTLTVELDRVNDELAKARDECKTQDDELKTKVDAASKQLQASHTAVNRLIGAFAQAAKDDAVEQMEALSTLTRAHNALRENLRDVIESAASASEMITLSLCGEGCGVHGTCWSGVCRHDNDQAPTTTAQRERVGSLPPHTRHGDATTGTEPPTTPSSPASPSPSPSPSPSVASPPSATTSPSASASLASSRSPSPSASPSASSAASRSTSPTPTPTPTVTPSTSVSFSATPSVTVTPSVSDSNSRTPSPTISTTSTASHSPSPSPYANAFQPYFIGMSGTGAANGPTRDQAARDAFQVVFSLPLVDGTGYAVTSPAQGSLDKELRDFSVADGVELYWDRDVNCGQSASEQKCSCERTCGQEGKAACCASLHRPTVANIGGGFQPLFGQQVVMYSVACNGAWLPHAFVGVPAHSGAHYIDDDGNAVFVHDPTKWATEGTGELRFPFLPDHTATSNQGGRNYCKPSAPVSARDIARSSPCAGMCGLQAHGGCFCTDDCGANEDCCDDVFAGVCGAHDAPVCPGPGVMDCNGSCVDAATAAAKIGNGVCDAEFNCASLHHTNYDGGDCFQG